MSDISTIFPAHICDHRIQSVDEHCRNVARYAQSNLGSLSLKNVAFLAGVLHDAGKYTDSFKQYIEAAANGEDVIRGSVNHTFAGVEFIQKRVGNDKSLEPNYALVTKDIIGYVIGSHHGQFDCIDEDGKDGIDYRIHNEGIPYETIWDRFRSNCCDAEELNNTFESAVGEVKNAIEIFLSHCDVPDDKKECVLDFYLGCLTRLISSAVIDGDRCDTASFMNVADYPVIKKDLSLIWSEQLKYLEEKITTLDKSLAINKARAYISEQCRESANEDSAIFRLNVPTGGGKTISSLRFALAHAANQKKKRIFFVSPLLSILEQNAAVIKDYISDSSLILEHHSNVVQPESKDDELNCNELFTENWSAPIIITTLVQMLNTMFAGKTSNIRRFHALADSVIVIDEVQSVPANMLSMFNLTITFLNVFCNSSVVLCSATQPYLEGTKYPVQTKIKDIVPYQKDLWKVFERTKLIDGGSVRFENLKARIEELLGDSGSMLVVCNKKTESERLYKCFSQEYTCFHISAAMCIEHRREVIDRLKEALLHRGKSPIICFSTQVIEAGVDISFEKVVRLLAGMENAVQAAGRCNRNKENDSIAPVYLVDCSDENLNALTEIKHQKEASLDLLYDFKSNSEYYENNLASETSIRRYYKNLYRQMDCNYQDFWVKRKGNSILDFLSVNRKFSNLSSRERALPQAFKTAGMEFKVFEDNTIDVIVPYKDGKEIIADFCSERVRFDLQYRKELIKKARAYTVTIYPYQKNLLEKENAIIKCSDDVEIWYLLDAYYDCNTGVTLEPNLERYMEV